jgi:hypothetical protein
MSKMANLMIEIQEDIDAGVLSFAAIAKKHNVPMDWVNAAWDELVDIQEDIDAGALSFAEIAKKHNVPMDWVNAAWEELAEAGPAEDVVDGDEYIEWDSE